jgi:two-component system cell cycle response regulator
MSRILIIEDNPDNLELMTYLLKAFGHETVSARDGEAGLVAARHEKADLIICDVHLPKKDGYAIAAALKIGPNPIRVPLVAVTALAMVGDRDKLLAAGFDGYIAKPIVPQEFVQQVEAFLPSGNEGSAVPIKAMPALPTENVSKSTEIRARVLIVDDSMVNHDLTRAILEPFGYRLLFATNVPQALALAVQTPLDLILSDLHMPDEDGMSFLATVKADARLRSIPFVLISSSAHGREDHLRARGLGAARFLLRPLEPRELIHQIEECLLADETRG